MFLGNLIGPLIGSSVAASYGIKNVFYVTMGVLLINAVIVFFNRRQHMGFVMQPAMSRDRLRGRREGVTDLRRHRFGWHGSRFGHDRLGHNDRCGGNDLRSFGRDCNFWSRNSETGRRFGSSDGVGGQLVGRDRLVQGRHVWRDRQARRNGLHSTLRLQITVGYKPPVFRISGTVSIRYSRTGC